MKLKTMQLCAVVLLSGVLLAGCGTTARFKTDGTPEFPDRNSAWIKEGTFPNVNNVRQVMPGLSKNQVYALIQEPHFSEGVFGVHVWNYIFNFRTGHGNDFVTCQYQVQYDDQSRVKATYWKEPECAQYLSEKPAAVPAITPAPASERFDLDFGVLFPFDKGAFSDLRSEGRAKLDNVVSTLSARYRHIDSIKITGYTDRIGTDDYNDKLSLQRAQTVRMYLAQRGLPDSAMSAAGLGKASPVTTNCPDGNSQATIRCLAPDRRATIEVVGDKR
ncbi:outer membrane protein assembly factor BamE [Burkholderia metallica]|uniref:OmpA family protein n=1 Tax=Burkholderia metallica TaxID=488729 RepID=UPI00157AC50B|nr:OmpA family protein [Burkholderia metallica]NTZ83609.1 outer membrane protein assembly factor BamE [Burkholderia metallica]